jgi:hypothetical protein
MLPFANTMFLDLLHEDGLLIAAKGLGIEQVFYSLLRVYSDPGNLVRQFGKTYLGNMNMPTHIPDRGNYAHIYRYVREISFNNYVSISLKRKEF